LSRSRLPVRLSNETGAESGVLVTRPGRAFVKLLPGKFKATNTCCNSLNRAGFAVWPFLAGYVISVSSPFGNKLITGALNLHAHLLARRSPLMQGSIRSSFGSLAANQFPHEADDRHGACT
jgi:hypothetical protein